MFTTLLTAASLVGLAAAAPLSPRQDSSNIDTTILQYALTLEHLENNFYSTALGKYDEAAFVSAGFPAWVRKRLVQIGQHEKQHVTLLSGALGDAATQPCEYSFPYTDVASFLGLSAAIENVGVSAYLGAANLITDPAYVTVAGSILTTEARHQTWVSAAALKGAPWSGPEDTPLGFSQVYSIAAAFITSCPSSNPTLPVKAFPAATIAEASPKAGDKVTLKFPTTGQSENLIIYSGLMTYVAPIASDATVTIPSNLQGISYGVITTASDASSVSDDSTVAGPIIMNFGVPSSAVNA